MTAAGVKAGSTERERDKHRFREQGFWQAELLTDRVRSFAEVMPDRTALVDGDDRYTWSELWRAARGVAARLGSRGVYPGDVVSTQLPNGYSIVVLHLATELVGAVHNPIAMQFREHELDQLYGLLRPVLMVFPDGDPSYEAIHAATQAGRAGKALKVSDLLTAPVAGGIDGYERSPARPSDYAFILNTSGTVSVKGVVHSHEEAMYSTRTVGLNIVGLTPGDTVVCAIPMTWGGGLAWGLRVAIHAGATLVSLPRWNPEQAVETIDRTGGSFIYGPPTLARDLVGLADHWSPRGPFTMICAGAPIPRQLCRDAKSKLGMTLIPGYGQTEHLHSALGRRTDTLEQLTTTDGSTLPGVSLDIVDEEGKSVPEGQSGEILCRGPNVAMGYVGQQDLTAEVFRPDGWQVTQDLGRMNEEGYLRVTGRKRDIIIRGGLNVSPREVEELLATHPDVRDVAVIGVPDPRYGERICAFVVPAGGTVPTVAELSEALGAQGVARYKYPEEVREIEALPLTTTGKVRAETLREMVRHESAGCSTGTDEA